MSTIEPVPPPPPDDDVMWWVSPTLRSLVGLISPAVVLAINGVLKLLHKGPTTMTKEAVAELGVAGLAAFCAWIIAKRRVARGKNPADPAPAIKMRIV